jgi:ADP-ribosylglycohydrolase
MLGAIAGDVIGSVYEHRNIKTTDFPLLHKYSRFTDDTVLTIAIADAILHQTDYANSPKFFGRKYPDAGYGVAFIEWIFEPESKPYNSWGNGSAMRVSPRNMFKFPIPQSICPVVGGNTNRYKWFFYSIFSMPQNIKRRMDHFGQ